MFRWFLTEGDSNVAPTSAMNCERSRGGNPTDVELRFPFLGAKTFPATDYPHPGYNMPNCFPVRNVPMGELPVAFNFFALDLLNDSFSDATKISIMTNQSHPPVMPLYVAYEGIVGVDVLRPRITWNQFPYSYFTGDQFVYSYEFHEIDITEAEILAIIGNNGLNEQFRFYLADGSPIQYQFWFVGRLYPNKMLSTWGYYWNGWDRCTWPMEVGYRVRLSNGPSAVFESYFEITKAFPIMEFAQVGLTNNNVLDFLGAGQKARFWFLNFPPTSSEETSELVYWFTRNFSVVARMKVPVRDDFVFLLNFTRGLVDASDNRYEVVHYDADDSYQGPNNPPVVENGECAINGGEIVIRDVVAISVNSPYCFDFKIRTDMSFQDFSDWIDNADFSKCTIVDTNNFDITISKYGNYIDIEYQYLAIRIRENMLFDGNWHHIAVVRNPVDEVTGMSPCEIFFDGRNSRRGPVDGFLHTYWIEYGDMVLSGADWRIGDKCPFYLDEIRLSTSNPFVSDFIPYSTDYAYGGMPDLEFVEIASTSTTTEAPDLDGSTMLYHCQDQMSENDATRNSYADDFPNLDTGLYGWDRFGSVPVLTYLGKFEAGVWLNGGLISGSVPNIDCRNDVMVEFWAKFPAQSFGVSEEYKVYNLFRIGKFEGRIDVSPSAWWYVDENNDPIPGFCASIAIPSQDAGEDGILNTYIDIPEEELFDGNYHHFVFFYDAMRDIFHVRLDGGLGHTILGYDAPSPQNIFSIEDYIVADTDQDDICFGEWQSDQPTIDVRIDEIRIMWGIDCPFNNGEDGNNWFEVPTEQYVGPNEGTTTTTTTTTESTTTEEPPPA